MSHPVTLPRSREVRVEIDGRVYRIFIAWPSEPPPAAGFPAIYCLDANAAYATVVEAVRMRSHRPDATGVWPALVVGIGYPGDGPYQRDRRTYDYTRRGSQQADGGDGREAPAVGGAERFRELLLAEVPALVGKEWPLDPNRRTVVGHSLGGYFVLETLAAAPDAFRTYVAISPSIWWDEPGLMARLAELPGRLATLDGLRNVLITVGEYEQKLAPWQEGRPPVLTVAERRQDRRMVDLARACATSLSQMDGLTLRFEVLAGQDHASVVPPTIGEAVRLAFR